MTLGMWLLPIRSKPEVRGRLIQLGVVYLGFCLTAGVIATLPFLGDIGTAVGSEGEIDEAAVIAAMRGPFITFGLLYVLISALFWHAPALTGWHGIKMTQAMFYSMVACWRNKLPFLAYGASWAAIFFALQTLAAAIVSIGLSPASMQMILTPVNLALAAVLYCSFYPAYISVFGANYPIGREQDESSSPSP